MFGANGLSGTEYLCILTGVRASGRPALNAERLVMGEFGIAGLWGLLALSLVGAVLVAAAGIWLSLFGGVVLLGLGGFMRLGSTRAHIGLLGAVAVLLGLLLFIVFWLDHPFGNQLGVTSEPFEQSQNAFDSIDRGT